MMCAFSSCFFHIPWMITPSSAWPAGVLPYWWPELEEDSSCATLLGAADYVGHQAWIWGECGDVNIDMSGPWIMVFDKTAFNGWKCSRRVTCQKWSLKRDRFWEQISHALQAVALDNGVMMISPGKPFQLPEAAVRYGFWAPRSSTIVESLGRSSPEKYGRRVQSIVCHYATVVVAAFVRIKSIRAPN